MPKSPLAMKTCRTLTILLGLLGAGTAPGQVYDWSMQPGSTVPNNGGDRAFYGPRNYLAAGTFNSCTFTGGGSFNSCDELDVAAYAPPLDNFNGYGVTPARLFDRYLPWPYAFRWYCSFDEKYGFTHPAPFQFGVLSVNFHEVTGGNQARYNYMLFELKQPLDAGVPFVFQGSLAAASPFPSLGRAHVEGIGVALLHDLSGVDSLFAFLDSITPQWTTPPGVLQGANAHTFSDTLIGNGERYLVVGLFDPIDSLLTDPPPAPGVKYEYVLDNWSLYRRDCNNANAQFWEPDDHSCREDPYELELQYPGDVGPFRQWYLDGAFQTDSTATSITIPYNGLPETVVTAVVDTGACMDTAHFTVQWRGLDVALADTFTVCGQPVELDPLVTQHYVTQNLDVDWTELTGTFSLYDQTGFSLILPDSGTYAYVTSFHGCQQRDTLVVGPDRPLVDTTAWGDPSLLVEVSPEHCVNMYDGAVEWHDQGYPGVLSFDWYDPPLMLGDTSRADSLTAGTYLVRITDDQYRCTESAHVVPQLLTGCAKVMGRVYEDADLDCLPDSAETPHALVTVTALPVGNVAVTAMDGSYELLVPPGSYTVWAESPDPWVGVFCGQGTAVSLGQPGDVVDSADFADTTHVPVHDLRLEYAMGGAWVIGNTATVTVSVRNTGELPEAATLRAHLDHPSLQFQPAVGGAVSSGFVGDTLVADLGILLPGAQHYLLVSTILPPNPGLLGSVPTLHFSLPPVVDEADSTDNETLLQFQVLGAYDPNDKLVSPIGDEFYHAVDTTVKELRYTIRFQNTGNYPATTVRLEDELPPLLVLQSLEVVASSHPMQAYSFGQVLYFEFPTIMLPDSASDPNGSIGWVQFVLDVAPTVQYGDSIVNSAAIYFDQNPPIITPPAITRFLAPLSTQVPAGGGQVLEQRFVLAPNPAQGVVTVMDRIGAATILRVELIDGQGSLHATTVGDGRTLALQGLGSGVYTVRIFSSEGLHVLRLVKY